MAPLQPEALSVSGLPRGRLGHLNEEAVADLLQRAAWDYREALAQNQRLARTVEELTQRVDELTAQVASLEAAAVGHRDPDELARTLLAAAQRSAREERESTRRQAELMLKKAAQHAERMKEDFARREAERLSELDRLEALRENLAVRLREMLETIAGLYEDRSSGGEAEEGDAPADAEAPGRGEP